MHRSYLPEQGCGYSFTEEGALTLRWGDGREVIAPVEKTTDAYEQEAYFAVYVSDSVTAVSHFSPKEIVMRIYTSRDRGESWTTDEIGMSDPTPPGAEVRDFYLDIYPAGMWLSFPSATEGRLILTTYYGMSNGRQLLFTTADGGMTWERTYESGWRRYAVGGGFSSRYGFISLVHTDESLPILRSGDGGKTWDTYDLRSQIPEEYREMAQTAYSPVFEGDYGRWLIRGWDEASEKYAEFVMITRDGGETWEFGEVMEENRVPV